MSNKVASSRALRHRLPHGEVHVETLIIYKLSSRNFTTQNDLYFQYQSERVVILIETKFIIYECLQMRVRPFHQKSTCLTQLKWEPYLMQMRLRNTPETGFNETPSTSEFRVEGSAFEREESIHTYRGTSLKRNFHPPRATIGP